MPDIAAITTIASRKRGDSQPAHTAEQILVVFEAAGVTAAFPIETVERIVPMVKLVRPPGLPSMLEGILNSGGVAVPVLRFDRLFQLPQQNPGLYSALILMKGDGAAPLALLVDRVERIVNIDEKTVIPVGGTESFNACSVGNVAVDGQVIHWLSPARILLATERKALHEFQQMAQRRLHAWEFDQA